jgi:hypothetical protein
MKTMPNLEDFRLSPEQIAAAMKQQLATKLAPQKSKHEIEFYQFPKVVVDALARANNAPAWALAAAVYKGWYKDRKHRNPVKLTSTLLVEFGVSKDQKFRALKILEETGQFLVEHSRGRNPLVMMKWKLVKDGDVPHF